MIKPLFHRIPIALAALALVTSTACASLVRPNVDQRGAVTRIPRGVVQLGVSDSLSMTYVKEGSESSFRTHLIQSLGVRYFVKDNLGVSFYPGVVYRKAGRTRDLGFQGVAWVNHYVRIGPSVFLAPGAGAGMFVGQRDTPIDDANVVRTSIVSGLIGIELPVVVFGGRSLSARAGPEFVFAAGASTPADGNSQAHVLLDGGFKVGLTYRF